MDTKRETFRELLWSLKGEEAVEYALGLLRRQEVDIPGLYEKIIAPALQAIDIPRDEESQMIWREHLMTAHCRSLVERCRTMVLDAAPASGAAAFKKVMIFAPSEEYHELGMRMGMDFFTLAGAQVDYVGANLPLSNVSSAVTALAPDLVCISVTNPLNLTLVDEYVLAVRAASQKAVSVALTGSAAAFYDRQKSGAGVPDLFIATFAEIQKAGGGRP